MTLLIYGNPKYKLVILLTKSIYTIILYFKYSIYKFIYDRAIHYFAAGTYMPLTQPQSITLRFNLHEHRNWTNSSSLPNSHLYAVMVFENCKPLAITGKLRNLPFPSGKSHGPTPLKLSEIFRVIMHRPHRSAEILICPRHPTS